MKAAGQFTTKIRPKLLIPYDLYRSIMQFVNGTDANECQWYHSIERLSPGIYRLYNMYIPEQTVTAGTVEASDTSWLGILNEIRAEYTVNGEEDWDSINKVTQSLHVWAHSHVNMTASPSTVDQKTFAAWIEKNADVTSPIMMMIVNRREEVYTNLYEPTLGVFWENMDIEIEYEEFIDSYVVDALASKIKKPTFTVTQWSRHDKKKLGQKQQPIILGTGIVSVSNTWVQTHMEIGSKLLQEYSIDTLVLQQLINNFERQQQLYDYLYDRIPDAILFGMYNVMVGSRAYFSGSKTEMPDGIVWLPSDMRYFNLNFEQFCVVLSVTLVLLDSKLDMQTKHATFNTTQDYLYSIKPKMEIEESNYALP